MGAPQPISSLARTCLIGGAIGSFAIALLYLVILFFFVGAPGYRHFGAAALAGRAQEGSLVPAFITAAITVVFSAVSVVIGVAHAFGPVARGRRRHGV